jgi:hypothetical protein
VQDTCLAFDDDIEFKEDNHVFVAMLHLASPHHVIHALSTVSGHLAEAFAKNFKQKGLHETVLMTLHTYEDVFGKIAFDVLPQCWKWDHTIELECKPSQCFKKSIQ